MQAHNTHNNTARQQHSSRVTPRQNLPPLRLSTCNNNGNVTSARSSIRSLMTKRSRISSSSTARLSRNNHRQKMRTSRSTPTFRAYMEGSPGNTLVGSLQPSGSVLVANHRQKDLLLELSKTNERMKVLMEQRQAALLITLAKTNRMIHSKMEHAAHINPFDSTLSARRNARDALQRIEAKNVNLPKNIVPYKKISKFGWRTDQDSSGFIIGCGKGIVDGSPFQTSYQSQSNFSGVSNTARSRMKAVDRRAVLCNPLPQSEFKDFVEKAIKLGIDLRKVGHT